MDNYTNKLFTIDGASPSYLPNRLRLPSGDTRYTNNITLEEIKACGYDGPIEIPSFNESECVRWCSDTKQFLIEQIDPAFYSNQTDFICRLELKEIIANRDASLRSKLVPDAQIKYDIYYAQVLNLLLSSDLITQDKIPTLSLNFLDYEAERAAYVKNQIFNEKSLRRMQYNYEYLGVWPQSDPQIDPIYGEAINNFFVPSTWVPSGSLSPEQIQFWKSQQNEEGYFIG